MGMDFSSRMGELLNKQSTQEEPVIEIESPESNSMEEMLASAALLGQDMEEDCPNEVADLFSSAGEYNVGDTKVISTPIGDIPYGSHPIMNFQIEDTSGKFKNKLMDLVNRTGSYIIPASLAQVPPQVVNIKDFEILEFGGVRYYCSNMGKAPEPDLRDYCDMIISSLKRSGNFSGTLMYRVQGTGYDFNTLRFGKQDLSNILATFEGWRVQVVAKGEDLYLMVD